MYPSRWVDTWVAVPQPTPADLLPPPSFTQDGFAFRDSTLRQTVRVSVGGSRLRLSFSNAFGGAALRLAAVGVALPSGGRAGVSTVAPGTSRRVTFQGRGSVVVPPGEHVESDPLEMDVPAGGNLTVSAYLDEGQARHAVTSHPGSRTTSYLVAGDRVGDTELPGAVPVDHWYFLRGLRVPANPATAVAVLVGDSLTDGNGSTTNQNNRWPDQLFERLQHSPDTSDIAVLRHAAGGTRLLDDGQGPDALGRLIRGVLAREALRWLVLFKGVNDIGTAPATDPAQQQIAADLIGAYERIIRDAREDGVREDGVRVYGATLLPFGGHEEYDDPGGHRNRARVTVNEWVRTSNRFDYVLDFDRAVCDPAAPHRLLPAFDLGDHLHVNPAGYRRLAEAVPDCLFLAT